MAHRILHVIADAEIGGAQVYLIELARQQRSRGIHVTIASGGRGPLETRYRDVADRYIAVSSLRRAAGPRDALAAAIIGRLGRDADVVHAHASKALAATVLSRPIHRRPIVWSAHGYDSAHADFDVRVRGVFDRAKAFLARQADAVTVASNSVREKALAAGIGPGRVRVVYTGVSQEQLLRVPPPTDGPFTVGAAGRLVALKGFDRLVEAMALVTERRPEARAVLYGSGPEEQRLRARIAELRLEERFTIHTLTDDLPLAFRAMHVVVVPSIVDSFPLVPLEAMVAARPVIVSRVGGLPDALIDGEHGFVVPAGDPVALAAAIERLAADRPRAREMGEAARGYAAARFRWDRMADEYDAIYGAVAQ